VIKHLRDYIHTFGEKGGADRVIVAYAKIGTALWHQSCPVKEVDGECVKITRERAISKKANKKLKGVTQTQCGPESKIKLTVVKRDERKLKEAMDAFRSAIDEYKKKGPKFGDDDARNAAARYHFGLAMTAQADKDFEAYLSLGFPANLNFDPQNKAIKEKSLKRFDEWVKQKTKIGGDANKKYEDVLAIKDPANSIAAAARIGQISQNFSDALFTAEIPKDVRSGEFAEDKVDAFCDQMSTVADPLEKRSLEAFGICLSKSTELGWFSDWSKLCEHELGQIKPEDFPTASEVRGDPDEVAPVTDVEPPTAKLE
jgi:hypothetical protein